MQKRQMPTVARSLPLDSVTALRAELLSADGCRSLRLASMDAPKLASFWNEINY